MIRHKHFKQGCIDCHFRWTPRYLASSAVVKDKLKTKLATWLAIANFKFFTLYVLRMSLPMPVELIQLSWARRNRHLLGGSCSHRTAPSQEGMGNPPWRSFLNCFWNSFYGSVIRIPWHACTWCKGACPCVALLLVLCVTRPESCKRLEHYSNYAILPNLPFGAGMPRGDWKSVRIWREKSGWAQKCQ